jgi:thioesterase domain-containing protein
LSNLIKEDRPVYAIQCRGVDGSPVQDMDIEEMAVTYLEEIRNIQPKGPYYIGGYCFGGYLSLEIAHLLNSENEEVKLLVMINSATYQYGNYKSGMTKLHRIFCKLGDRIALEWDELTGQPIRKKIQRIMMRVDRMNDLILNKVEILLDKLPEWFPLRMHKHSLVYYLEQVADANDRAWERYRPKSYNGKILFFRARRQPLGIIPDPMLGWKDLLTGEVHFHEVPGFRQTMLDETYVSEIAEIILKHLP